MIKTENKNFQHPDLPLLIIPAAGFGRRVGSPLSKEILPGSGGEALINYSLEQAALRAWPVHLITRKEKIDLIQHVQNYCREKSLQLEIQLIEESREWPDSVLKSEKYWRQKNILCLPDTVFKPLQILDDMNLILDQGVDLAVAGFWPEETSSWGFMRILDPANFQICEKPQKNLEKNDELKAWGLLAFKASIGKPLFEAQLESTFDHNWKAIKGSLLFSELASFEDVTRQAPRSLL